MCAVELRMLASPGAHCLLCASCSGFINHIIQSARRLDGINSERYLTLSPEWDAMGLYPDYLIMILSIGAPDCAMCLVV